MSPVKKRQHAKQARQQRPSPPARQPSSPTLVVQPELFGPPVLSPPTERASDRLAPDVSGDADPQLDLIRSQRRRRTYRWSIDNGRLRLEVPAGLRASDEARIVQDVLVRVQKRQARAARPADEALLARGRDLARQYVHDALARLRSVAWSERQGRRWGSCTHDSGEIRLSSRLHGMPAYVLEAVLVHELAHLIEPNHSPGFRELAERYPLAERARGFLEAVDRGHAPLGDDWAEGRE
jgi:predicted metal-dependent hydrolase